MLMHKIQILHKIQRGLLLALVCLAGCAHGSDGAYQAESTANGFIGAGYRAVKAHARATADEVKALASKDVDAAQRKLDVEKKLTAAALKVLDVASDATDAEDAAIAAAEAVRSKDYSVIVARLVQIGLDVVSALRTLGISLPGVR